MNYNKKQVEDMFYTYCFKLQGIVRECVALGADPSSVEANLGIAYAAIDSLGEIGGCDFQEGYALPKGRISFDLYNDAQKKVRPSQKGALSALLQIVFDKFGDEE